MSYFFLFPTPKNQFSALSAPWCEEAVYSCFNTWKKKFGHLKCFLILAGKTVFVTDKLFVKIKKKIYSECLCCFCHVLNVLSTRWQYSSVYRLAGRLFPCRWLDKKKFMMQSFSKLPNIAKWSNNFQLYLYYHISAFHRVIYYLHFYGHGLWTFYVSP